MNEPATKLDTRFSDPDAVATEWDETRRVLETAELFWISTVRSDGRPHVTPLVAVWLDGAIHFATGATEQKAVNLSRNPHVILTTGCNQWDRGLSTNRQIFWDSPDNRQDTSWASIISCKEVLGSGDQGFKTLEELAMRDFPAKMSPEHLHGIEPGTVGRQIQPYQASRRTPHHGFNVVVFMRSRVIPRHRDGLCGVLLQERVQQCRALATPFVRCAQDHGLSCMVIDGANTRALRGLAWRGDHHLLACRTPQGFAGRQPGQIARIGRGKDLPWLQAIAGRFNRLFFPWYSGAGLLILCWGRLKTMSASCRCRRTVSAATRMPVCSAIESAKRARVQSA